MTVLHLNLHRHLSVPVESGALQTTFTLNYIQKSGTLAEQIHLQRPVEPVTSPFFLRLTCPFVLSLFTLTLEAFPDRVLDAAGWFSEAPWFDLMKKIKPS